jgi:YesN/AraC family two-component response regulator
MDGLPQALEDGLPRVLAWDVDDNSLEIQKVLQYLYEHPVLSEVPFLLFDSAQHMGDTNILLKPVRSSNLLSFITANYRSEDSGPILIVDDDSHARQFYLSVITEHLPAYEVTMVENGRQALESISETLPSLVILDLMMPEMDGFEVIQWMRSQPAVVHVPVVILSGKLLSFEDIQRLKPYRKIAFQTKRILDEDELAAMFQQAVVRDSSSSSDASAIANHAVAFIQNHYNETIARQDIADAIGVSENYLTQVFHSEMGIALWEYLNRYRITKSKDLLTRTQLTIAQVATQVGFEDPAYFSRVFRRHTGRSPRAYRKST